jgi:hypothetical protein
MPINGASTLVGNLYATVLPSGDIQVTYVQENVNDNRYGTGATAATGWSKAQSFNNLVGSDKAEFRFTDSLGNVVLDFYCDYITASVAFPSGYGCLGATGGDGSMVSGSAANILLATTSLSENLKQSQFVHGYTVNSPPETSPLSGISVPAGWDYNNSYTVVISKAAFGAAGFGGVTIPGAHDSPPKIGSSNLITPTPCNGCIVNTAVASGTSTPSAKGVTAQDSAQVCFGTSGGGGNVCNITKGATTLDKNQVKVPLKNSGSTAILLSELTLSWPQAVNGKLKKATLNGDIWAGLGNSPIALTTAEFNAFNADANRRTIAPGQTKTLVLQFEHNVSKDPSLYTGTVKFGADASCVISLP